MTRARPTELELRRTARRIGLQTAGLLMACLVVVGAVLYGSVVRSQDEQLSTSLSDAVGTAGTGRDADHDHDHDLNEPRGGIQYAVLDGRGLRTSADVPPGLPDLDVLRTVATTHVQDRRTLRLASGGFEVLTVQRGDDTVQVIASTFEQHQERERIIGGLALAGGAGLVLATLAAAVLARRAVRPMAQALEQQRRFVADAGHELRTPLTLLSTRSQLLARRVRDTTTPAEQRDQLVERDATGIVADTAALVAILEDLLTEADDRTPVPQDPVDLAEVARSVVASGQAAAVEAGVVLRTSVGAADLVVPGAATALARAVSALVDNAVDHARTRSRSACRGPGGRWSWRCSTTGRASRPTRCPACSTGSPATGGRPRRPAGDATSVSGSPWSARSPPATAGRSAPRTGARPSPARSCGWPCPTGAR